MKVVRLDLAVGLPGRSLGGLGALAVCSLVFALAGEVTVAAAAAAAIAPHPICIRYIPRKSMRSSLEAVCLVNVGHHHRSYFRCDELLLYNMD